MQDLGYLGSYEAMVAYCTVEPLRVLVVELLKRLCTQPSTSTMAQVPYSERRATFPIIYLHIYVCTYTSMYMDISTRRSHRGQCQRPLEIPLVPGVSA